MARVRGTAAVGDVVTIPRRAWKALPRSLSLCCTTEESVLPLRQKSCRQACVVSLKREEFGGRQTSKG